MVRKHHPEHTIVGGLNSCVLHTWSLPDYAGDGGSCLILEGTLPCQHSTPTRQGQGQVAWGQHCANATGVSLSHGKHNNMALLLRRLINHPTPPPPIFITALQHATFLAGQMLHKEARAKLTV